MIDKINSMIFQQESLGNIDTNDVYDGQHTFGQLYFQRMMLFATLVNLFPELSWKTKRHEDGEECFGGGWFLVTIDTPEGAYGYHYQMKYWDKFNCSEIYKAKKWDGYTEENVDRLFSLIDVKKHIGFLLNKSDKEIVFSESMKTCGRCKHDYMNEGLFCSRCKRNPLGIGMDCFEQEETND